MDLFKKFQNQDSLKKIFLIILTVVITIFLLIGGYFYYYTNYVYSHFGKSNWSHQNDKEAGKQLIELSLLNNNIVTYPKDLNQVYIDPEIFYPGYYWYQDGIFYYFRFTS